MRLRACRSCWWATSRTLLRSGRWSTRRPSSLPTSLLFRCWRRAPRRPPTWSWPSSRWLPRSRRRWPRSQRQRARPRCHSDEPRRRRRRVGGVARLPARGAEGCWCGVGHAAPLKLGQGCCGWGMRAIACGPGQDCRRVRPHGVAAARTPCSRSRLECLRTFAFLSLDGARLELLLVLLSFFSSLEVRSCVCGAVSAVAGSSPGSGVYVCVSVRASVPPLARPVGRPCASPLVVLSPHAQRRVAVWPCVCVAPNE
mmetsp:Transcript_24557/g.77167  ORF Transcript_24557/g.77167 Transcript_24557/m.77167 type:complete len:255 (+) Transcript_24557:356-1120(+)